MTLIEPQAPDRDRLARALESGPSYWRPVWTGLQAGLCSIVHVLQTKEPFRLGHHRLPMVVYIGDDPAPPLPALGPDGFHRESLGRVIETCTGAIVIGCEPVPRLYAMLAEGACLNRQNMVLIETRAEHEIPWVEFLRECRPDIGIVLGAVQGGTA